MFGGSCNKGYIVFGGLSRGPKYCETCKEELIKCEAYDRLYPVNALRNAALEQLGELWERSKYLILGYTYTHICICTHICI